MEQPIKTLTLCDKCVYGFYNVGCPGEGCLEDCPMIDPDKQRCRCVTQRYGEPCEFFRPLEAQNEAD